MINSNTLLAGLPLGLRAPLLQAYQEITLNYIEHRWEPSELNGGKFCEVVYTIISDSLAGVFSSKPSKPNNMVDACRALEKQPADPNRVGDKSFRILIPRMLLPLYEIRNNRGVGHVGGDVDPNFLDATAVHAMAGWILAELIRVFHNVSTEEAQEAVNTIVERKHPMVWEVEDTMRVLDPSMGAKDQTLLLLYGKPSWVPDNALSNWVEYSTLSMFIKRVLEPLHKARLIEYDRNLRRAHISPLGVKEVEQSILKTY